MLLSWWSLQISLVTAEWAYWVQNPVSFLSKGWDWQMMGQPLSYISSELRPDQSRRDTFPMPLCHGIKLEEATIDQLQTALSHKMITSTQLVECYLNRMQQTDKYLSSIIEINPDVLDIAAQLDNDREAGKMYGPLHGIPFLVKDNIASKDKMETTAGSDALLGSIVPSDAYVVRRLREAGAILMGHSNMDEWAGIRTSKFSGGYSTRGGQTRNPYNLTTWPGGTSSGSAAAVAANLVSFALGTETDGSVSIPAFRNGLVGIKPTLGLTSRNGVIPESHNQDTVGCLSRTVKDGVHCLNAIYGVDPNDNYTLSQIAPDEGFLPFVAKYDALRGARFGLPWLSFWQYAESYEQEQLRELLVLIERAGAIIINGTELPSRKDIIPEDGWDWDFGTKRGYPNESEYTYVKVDFYNDIAKYLSKLENTDIKSVEDIVQFNLINVGTHGGLPNVHPAFPSGQDRMLEVLETKGVMDDQYWQALDFCHRATREQGIDAALHNDGNAVDLLLVPTESCLPGMIAAQAGYPMVVLPAGVREENGVPFGLTLMGSAWSEATLIKYASAIEDLQSTSETNYKRQKPKWLDYRKRNIPVYV